jgi:cobyrinic acid a,c-diamide synthase
MLSQEQNLATFHRHADGADVCIVEGATGLFDGRDGKSEEGSTAQMAKWLGAPVVLVLDTFEIGRSAAAMLKGYQAFDAGVKLEGLLLNRVVDEEHTQRLAEAIEASDVSIRVLGGVPKVRPASLALPAAMRTVACHEQFLHA